MPVGTHSAERQNREQNELRSAFSFCLPAKTFMEQIAETRFSAARN